MRGFIYTALFMKAEGSKMLDFQRYPQVVRHFRAGREEVTGTKCH